VAAVAIVFAIAFGFGSRPAWAEDSGRGAALFDLCATCHAADGSGNRLYGAPAIAGMGEWYITAQLEKFRNGLRGAHPDDVNGLRMRPMSRTLASDADVAAVAAFVASLPATRPTPVLSGGDPIKGKALYITCGACHGVNGEGLQPLNGPSLNRTNDWYLIDQLRKYKAGIRGGSTANVPGILMRPMALALDDQAMKDVLAHIATLPE
jgi:cytochrome c553